MVKEFNNLKEIKKYYDEESNTYIFKENGIYIDLVVFNFNLNVTANINASRINAKNIHANNIYATYIYALKITANDINAWDINASDINARDINVWNIMAYNITANDIRYYAVCFVYKNIKCKSIKRERKNHKHFILDGVLEVK